MPVSLIPIFLTLIFSVLLALGLVTPEKNKGPEKTKIPPYVVTIVVKDKKNNINNGSGILLEKNISLVLTALHVLGEKEAHKSIRVFFQNGKSYEAVTNPLITNHFADLAILKIKAPRSEIKNLPQPAKLQETPPTKADAPFYIIGSRKEYTVRQSGPYQSYYKLPTAILEGYDLITRKKKVNLLGTNIPFSDLSTETSLEYTIEVLNLLSKTDNLNNKNIIIFYRNFYVFEIRPKELIKGYSGGPIVDSKNRVVGIISRENPLQGTVIAIPAREAKNLLESTLSLAKLLR